MEIPAGEIIKQHLIDPRASAVRFESLKGILTTPDF